MHGRGKKRSRCPKGKSYRAMPDLAAFPPWKMNAPAPAPKETQVFNPCFCTGLSSRFLFSVLSAFRLVWLNMFPDFSLLFPLSSPQAISHAFPRSLPSSGKAAAPSGCLRLWGLLSMSKVSIWHEKPKVPGVYGAEKYMLLLSCLTC